MKKMYVLPFCIFMLPLFTTPVHALHPELSIPEQVDVKHRACRDMMRLAEKYKVEAVFPEGFAEGKVLCSRLELAASLELITEKMAEKALKDGAQTVSQEDLLLVNELKNELRGETLLVNTRTFQQRHEEFGTKLHALTRNITLSGGMTGVIQGSVNNRPKDHVDAAGRGDLIFNFKVGGSTMAVLHLEATGGDGIDSHVPSFSLLNGVAGSTDDTVRFREAWIEHSAFDDRLLVTVGKIDLTNYFDVNAVANDENCQFLAGAFVNSAVTGAPPIGPGIRVQASLTDSLVVSAGYGSGTGESADVTDHGFGIVEIDYSVKLGGREGNYRIYGSLDGALPVVEDGVVVSDKSTTKNAFGYGLSVDQQLTEKVAVFGRYGRHDDDAYATVAAWSAGLQYSGLPGRPDDLIGVAYGQVQANETTAQEKLAEVYYRVKVNDQIAVSPHFQYLMNPQGLREADDIFVAGVRTQVTF